MAGEAILMRDGHAVVNVKVRNLPYFDAPDEVLEMAWEQIVNHFWHEAGALARKRGYAQVFAQGRSDGYCEPFYQRTAAGVTQFQSWPGQGPELGYPRYPDVEHDSAERERFRAFERDIRRLLAECREMYVELVREELAAA
jgi:hypothetical protein